MLEMSDSKHKRANGEGCIYQRKDKRWGGRLMCGRKPNGKPNIETFSAKTEAEARKKLNALIKKCNQDDFVDVRKISVGAYMLDWLKKVKINVLKPKAYDRLEATLLNQIIPYVGHRQLASFTAGDVQSLLNLLANEKGYSYSTVKKTYDAFNDCFRTGVIRREVTQNPALGVTVPKQMQTTLSDDDFDDGSLHFYSPDEVKRLIAAATRKYLNGKSVNRMGDIVPLAIYTGLRISELLGLKWNHVDFENRTIKVVDSLVVVIDRRADATKKRVMLDQKSTKTHSGRRRLPLNDVAYKALLRLHEITGEGTYVIATRDYKPVSPRNIDRILRCSARAAGFNESRVFGMHALRHTFASLLFAAGEDVKTVSEVLGHSGVEVTYNIYIHLIEESKALAVNKLVNF